MYRKEFEILTHFQVSALIETNSWLSLQYLSMMWGVEDGVWGGGEMGENSVVYNFDMSL